MFEDVWVRIDAESGCLNAVLTLSTILVSHISLYAERMRN
jgi:hypothetical protein